MITNNKEKMAFPHIEGNIVYDFNSQKLKAEINGGQGMSLHDYFAAKASEEDIREIISNHEYKISRQEALKVHGYIVHNMCQKYCV